jgi:hypothetical protein
MKLCMDENELYGLDLTTWIESGINEDGHHEWK